MEKEQWISKINQFVENNEDGLVDVSAGVTYSMRQVNDTSYRMYHRKLDVEQEENGFKNIFFPKMWVVYRSLVQNSDIDLKHLNIRIQDGVRVQIAPLLRMAYQSHLSRNGFGEFLDKVLAEMAWFGSSVVKRFDGGVDTVDWRNYITEPNNPNPQTRSHLEMLYRTKEQIDAYDFKEKEKIEKLWETMQKKGEHLFKLIEFWTFNKEGKKVCVKAIDNTLTEPDDFHEKKFWFPYIIVDEYESPFTKRRASRREREALGEFETVFPYEQFDLFQCFGRTQGFGCGELLSGLQEMYNDLFTNKRKADKKALMGITIHNAIAGEEGLSELTQEFISNLSEGSMITLAPGESIQNLPFDTRAQDFQIMEDKIYELMRQIIGISAQGTGEELPTATSATQAQINENSAQTVYNYVRERLHHGIKKLFNNGYSQDILEEIDEKEFLAIIGDPAQLEALDAFYTNNAMNSWALDVKKKTGRYPEQAEFDAVEEMLRGELRKLGDTRFPQFKKKIVKDLEYMFEFEITDESFNAIGRSQALMAIKADPMSTKSKARIEDELILMQGLNPRNFDKTLEEIEAERQMQQQAMPPEAKKAPEQFAQPL